MNINKIVKFILGLIFLPLICISPFIGFFFTAFFLSFVINACYKLIAYEPTSEVHTIMITGIFVFSIYNSIKLYKTFKYLYYNLSNRFDDNRRY